MPYVIFTGSIAHSAMHCI